MRFPPSFLDEIRARLPASAIVGRRVRLKKQGREWRGLSPFNAEKTPSFYVNDQKMAWFDFSSGKNGNIFDFVMLTEGVSFREAVERLAAEAGLDLPKSSPEAEKREEQRRSLLDVLELAASYFETTLQSRAGAVARGYLAEREIRPETQAQFRIGYATAERFGLRDHLAAKGVSREDMIATGLLVHGEDIAVPYDRFRDRVMFPIEDIRGRVVAFGGRALQKDVPAKYLNSPETDLFHKGSLLFNGHRARKAAHDTGRLVVVEGYVDVVMLTQAGISAAVAPLGTAMTEDQLDLAWRFVEEPILCFDGDKAGQRAAHRAVDLALPKIGPGRSVRLAFLPAGMDPDDLVRRRGREAMEEVLAAARPLADVLWERETAGDALSTPERRAAVEARLRGLVQSIADPIVRRHYEENVRGRLRGLGRATFNSDKAATDAQRRRGRRDWVNPQTAPQVAGKSLLGLASRSGNTRASTSNRETLLVALALTHPRILDRQAEDFAGIDFEDAEMRRLRDAILDIAGADPRADVGAVAAALDSRGLGQVRDRVLVQSRRDNLFVLRPEAATEDAEVSWLQAAALHRKARTLHRELRAAMEAQAQAQTEESFLLVKALHAELNALEGTEALIEGYGVPSGRAPRVG